MERKITQRELRNKSRRIMRALHRGKSFIITRNGVAVGELIPFRQRVFVPAEAAVAAFEGAPRLPARRFRKDVDTVIDQDAMPRRSRPNAAATRIGSSEPKPRLLRSPSKHL